MTTGAEVWLERRRAWTDTRQIIKSGKAKSMRSNASGTASSKGIDGHKAAREDAHASAAAIEAAIAKRRAAGIRAALDNAHDSQRAIIYDRIVVQRLKLKVPLNLRQVVPCLKQGWIKDGLWPKDAPDPASSTEETDPDV